MCGAFPAIQKIIDNVVKSTGAQATGWFEDEDRYGGGRDGLAQYLVSSTGVQTAKIDIYQGGEVGGFRLNPEPDTAELTIERVRGILVTALGVAVSADVQNNIKAFAAIAEELTKSCFYPSRYDFSIYTTGDPHLSLRFSNGLVSVDLETSAITTVIAPVLDLGGAKYSMSHQVAKLLSGDVMSRHQSGAILVEINGKWLPLVHVSAHSIRAGDEEDKTVLENVPSFDSMFDGSSYGTTKLALLTGLLTHFEKTMPGSRVSRFQLNKYSRNSREFFSLGINNADNTVSYSLEFNRG